MNHLLRLLITSSFALMRIGFVTACVFFFVFQSSGQCACAWIEGNKRSDDLLAVGRHSSAKPLDELTVGFFRRYDHLVGFYLVNVQGDALFPERFDRIEMIYPDSTFIGVNQEKKALYKIVSLGSLNVELVDIDLYWRGTYCAFYFLLDGYVYSRNEQGKNEKIGVHRFDSIFIHSNVSLDRFNVGFFYGASYYSQKVILQDTLKFKTILWDRLIFYHLEKGTYYSFLISDEKVTAGFQEIVIQDTLNWKKSAYYFGTDGDMVFYLPVNPKERVYALPWNESFKEYKNLKSKNLAGSWGYPYVVKQGKKSLLFFEDTVLVYRGKFEVVDVYSNGLSFVAFEGVHGIFNSDSLVLYKLEGGVTNFEACIQYIVTEDKDHLIHIYTLKGKEIATTKRRGYLLGTYYFDAETGEMLFRLKG